ncbi:MAG: hypothetical protein ACXVEE_06280 [Polyangiales bacterium]
MRFDPFVCCLIVTAGLGAGCSSPVLKGAKVADHEYLPETKETYVSKSCTTADGKPSAGSKAMYFVVHENGQPMLVERNLETDKESIVTNHWTEKDGEHYFWWRGKTAAEYVVPADYAEGVRRVYKDVEVAEAGGVTKSTSASTLNCPLTPVK